MHWDGSLDEIKKEKETHFPQRFSLADKLVLVNPF